MPNEDIDVSKLEVLEKYRVFTRYFKEAEKAQKKPQWWKTYRRYVTPKQGTTLGRTEKFSPVSSAPLLFV